MPQQQPRPSRLLGLVTALSIILHLAPTGTASAQDVNGIANMFGGIIGAAIVEQNRAEWRRLSGDDRTCIAAGVEREGGSIQQLIASGVSPNDERIVAIRQTCASIASRTLKLNVECSINTPQGTFTSRCDEDFSGGDGGVSTRVSRADALKAAFAEGSVHTSLYERRDAIARRQQMMSAGITSGQVAVPNFNCAKAHLPTQFAICNSATLSKLDTEYGELLRRQHGKPDASVAKQVTKQFNERNACGSSEDCIRHNMEASIEFMARALRKRGDDVVTTVEHARKTAQAEAVQAAAERRQAADAERKEADRQRRLESGTAATKELVEQASDFLKYDPRNPRMLTIAEAIASANAALSNGELDQIEAAQTTLSQAFRDDPTFAKYMAARAEQKSRESARLLGDAVKLAEQEKRFLVSYIAQNPTSAAAASSIGLVKRIEAILPHPDLKQLRQATAAVDAAFRQYGLQDNFLLSMNAVDDKPHADAEGGTPANLDIVATDHNRFLLDGSLGDLVLMYTAAPSAPHVVRNLRGDLVFGQGVASACIYEKDAGAAIRDRIQLALAKYALKQLFVEAAPCGFDGAPSVDIVAVERGVFLKQDPAYAAGLLKEVETGHVKPLLSVTDAQAETAIQSVETRRKQLEADIDHDALDGFALVVLPAVQSGPICGALKADLAAHEAILGRIADPAVGRLRAHLALESNTADDVFADVQRSRCAAVYASAADLKLLLDAFRREKIAYQLFPEPVLSRQLDTEKAAIASGKAQDEREALERRRQADEQRRLQALRNGDEANTQAARQAAFREKYGKIAAAGAALIANEVKDFVLAGGTMKPGDVGVDVPVEFPALAAWYVEQLKDRWELQSVDSGLDDYGAAAWKGRALEAALATVRVRLKNRVLGDYRDACFEVGRLVDHEFGVTRDPVDAPCRDTATIASWKVGHSFSSVWKVE